MSYGCTGNLEGALCPIGSVTSGGKTYYRAAFYQGGRSFPYTVIIKPCKNITLEETYSPNRTLQLLSSKYYQFQMSNDSSTYKIIKYASSDKQFTGYTSFTTWGSFKYDSNNTRIGDFAVKDDV